MSVTPGSIDVAAVRAHFPIEDVIRSAGVDLRPTGRGLMGCCPFHDDSTPSLSVGGVPDRFTCFGCGAHGDVIDFLQRLHGLSFLEAVRSLHTGGHLPLVADRHSLREDGAPLVPNFGICPDRGFEINAMAWAHLSTPVAVAFADSYLRCHRGIDLHPVRLEYPQALLAGHAGHGWTTLTDRLRCDGVSEDELLAMDLARATRAGRLVDALRERLVFPVTDPAGRIHGFIGRDLSDDPRAPKYLNPTRTPTFDKSTALYRPTHHQLSATGNVVVVEGVLDALAISAVAAAAGRSADFAPCTASGVAVTARQAGHVIELAAGRPPVIALDGDHGGAEGTQRWLTRVCREGRTPALVARLPPGMDPADWLREHGPRGLDAFDQEHTPATARDVAVTAPGRELARLALTSGGDPVRRAAELLALLAAALPRERADQLLDQAEREMTREGWNPHGQFTSALRHHASTRGRPAQGRDMATDVHACGAAHRAGPGVVPMLA